MGQLELCEDVRKIPPDSSDVLPGFVIVILIDQTVEISSPDLTTFLPENILQTLLQIKDLLHPAGLHSVAQVESRHVDRSLSFLATLSTYSRVVSLSQFWNVKCQNMTIKYN